MNTARPHSHASFEPTFMPDHYQASLIHFTTLHKIPPASRFVLSAAPAANSGLPVHLSPKSVFPTLDSVSEVIEHAKASLPAERFNEVYAILMAYHNTLLAELSKYK